MKLFHYHTETKEYVSTTEAEPMPRVQGEYIIPASCTTIPPSGTELDNTIFVFDVALSVWNLVSDYRGITAYNVNDGSKIIPELGWTPGNTSTFVTPTDVNNQIWNGSAWVFNRDKALTPIRKNRDKLLTACDYTQLSDVELTDAKKLEWKTYRQELRDFPETCDPQNPVWPTEPV